VNLTVLVTLVTLLANSGADVMIYILRSDGRIRPSAEPSSAIVNAL